MKPLNILLADDNKDDCYFFKRALDVRNIPQRFETVEDGVKLMKHLIKNAARLPDVLFLDLNMPMKTGFECLTEIKENTVLKDIPVVMFSTSFPRDQNYEQGMIKMLYKIGAVDFIRKSDDFTEMETLIHTSLKKCDGRENTD
jgi:CheY-like chemotaxis protein